MLLLFGFYFVSDDLTTATPTQVGMPFLKDSVMIEALLMGGGGKGKGTWGQATPGSTSKANARAVTLDDQVYVFGGYNGTSYAADFRCYDPSTDSWINKAGGPPARHYHLMAAAAGKICVYGGSGSGGTLSDLWVYDPIANTWASKTGAGGRKEAAVAAIGNKIYFCSGVTSSAVTPILNCYDIVTNTWTTLQPLPVLRYRSAMSAVGTKLYLYGGGNNTEPRFKEHWCYDTLTDTWTQLPDGPDARNSHTSVELGGKILVFGGSRASGHGDDLWSYDPVTNEWSGLKNGLIARTVHYAAAAQGKMFVGGGQSQAGFENTLHKYTP